jgi:hypothetical protein
MLSSPDRDLARRDAALPALPLLLDPDGAAGLMRDCFPAAGVRSAELRYTRYKPGTSCLAAYRVEAAEGSIAVHAKAHRPDAHAKLAKERLRRASDGPLGAGRVVRDDLAVAVAAFPNDARLRVLARLFEPAWRPKLLALLGEPHERSAEMSVRTLRYKPERRYVGAVLIGSRPSGAVRAYAESAYAAGVRAAAAFHSRGPLRVARRLGRRDDRRLLAVEWLPGEPLDGRLVGMGAADALAGTGAALAALHGQDDADLPYARPYEAGAGMRPLAEWLAFVHPPVGERAFDLADRLADGLAAEATTPAPTHGDFYARQVLVDAEAVGLVDLDEARWDDPASDLGNFRAHLERSVLRGELTAEAARAAGAALLDGYRRARPVDDRRVALQTAVGLFRLAPMAFRDHTPDWPLETAALLGCAERLLGGRAAPVRPAATGPTDPAMPWLDRALDARSVERLLRRLPSLRGALVRDARLMRHKPGRRALVEYRLEIEGDGILLCGKLRAKGLDERTFGVVAALWRRGFGADAPDGLSVPEPIGTVPELGMWLQRKAPGRPLTGLVEGPDGRSLVARAAEAAHKLQRVGVPTDRRHGVADELRILAERLGGLTETRPDWRARLAALLDGCRRAAAAARCVGTATVHRDFYPDQLLVDGDRLWLLDLDLYCLGDPALDIGNFVAHLSEQALRTRGAADALADREAAMAERFVALAGPEVRPTIRVYAALTLARLVEISTRLPERRGSAEALLELAERRLAEVVG